MKNQMNGKNGITLIALVITIIVLLILAGVAIATLTGDNGLIGKSGEAKNATEKSQEKEELEVAVLRFTDKRGNLDSTKIVDGLQKDIKNLKEVTNTDGKFPVKVEYKNGHKYGITKEGDIIENLIGAGDKAPDDCNAVYISGGDIAVIPAGFTVSAIENSIENGLVVTDGSNNEWVWIPTSSEDLAKMYVEDSAGWTMLGTSVNTKLKTRSLTQAEETETGMILRLGTRTLSRTNPGLTADPYYREPDVLSTYDTDPIYRTQAGFGDLTDAATKLKDDYKDMIESVRKNKGFYVGRYEIGKDSNNNPQVKKGTVMNNNWYNLYKACKSFSNQNAESRMIWGCQWDQVCRFIKGNGANSIIDNSRPYGNYANATGNASLGKGPVNGATGRSEFWKNKNMYDIAGNCWEWTQETYNTNKRVCRGRVFWYGWRRTDLFLVMKALLLTIAFTIYLHDQPFI